MCSQLPNCVCDAEDPRPSVEYLTERKRSIYDKLAEEGGGTLGDLYDDGYRGSLRRTSVVLSSARRPQARVDGQGSP
jgi:hypothetical protein